MIIHRVWASNVLKYATLDLRELPPQGLIGISGANEGGKSSIGETICFALFGRTFSYAEHEIVNVLRWGEPSCSAAVTFSISGTRYAVSRFLDAQGEQGARLSDAHDQPLVRGVEAVREALEQLLGFGFDEFIESFYLAQREIVTPHPHSTAVKKMAGIAALERTSAEARTEIAHEQAILGEMEQAIADTERCIADLQVDPARLPRLEQECHTLQALQEEALQQIEALQARSNGDQASSSRLIAAMEDLRQVTVESTRSGWHAYLERVDALLNELAQQDPDDATHAALLDDLRTVRSHSQQRLLGVDTLYEAAQAYRQHLARLLGMEPETPEQGAQPVEPLNRLQARQQTMLHAHLRHDATARTGLYVFLGLALIAWVIWFLLTQTPDSSIAQRLATWLETASSTWEEGHHVWLLPTAGILTLGFVLCGVYRLLLASKITQCQGAVDDLEQRMATMLQQVKELDGLDDKPLPHVVTLLAGFTDDTLSAAVRQFRESPGVDLIDAAPIEELGERLQRLQERFVSHAMAQRTVLAAQVQTLQDDRATRQQQIDQLGAHIADEQARQHQLHQLQASMTSHHDQMAVHHRRIQVRELACDLLMHGAQHMATTFNRDIRDLVSRTLPLLTQGRYEHLRIDEHLDVQVFSREKRDFMQLEEISTGTQRQIMLAVRLALSQQFINTTLDRHQFLFLDEPFAFFDVERTRSALQALPKLSHELSQIWIVAQAFPEDFVFDLHLVCEPGQSTLTWPRI